MFFVIVFLTTSFVRYDRLQLFFWGGGLTNVILHDCILLENKPITTYPTRAVAGVLQPIPAVIWWVSVAHLEKSAVHHRADIDHFPTHIPTYGRFKVMI